MRSLWLLKPAPEPGRPMLTSLRRCAPGKSHYFDRVESVAGSTLQPRSADGSKALAFTGKTALLKGRSNYLCPERLEQQALAGGDLPVQTLSDVILLRSGQIRRGMAISAPASAWRKIPGRPLVTSTNDNCLGSDCPLYKECFVVKARKRRWTRMW